MICAVNQTLRPSGIYNLNKGKNNRIPHCPQREIMRGIVLVVAALATLALAPSARAMQLDPLTLKIVESKVVRKHKPKVRVAPKPVVTSVIEYTIVEGDTLSKIAETHQTTIERLWQKNTQLTNPNILMVGEKLTIPSVIEVLTDRPIPAPQSPIANRPVVPGNAYDAGNCTWFVKTKRPDIGNYWGNGDQWGYSASVAGYQVDSIPSVGAIGVANGYNHVAYVEAVNGDGTISVSEMNYISLGVTSTRVAPINEFIYIH